MNDSGNKRSSTNAAQRRARPQLRRTDSMELTHQTRGGGVRSQIRFQTPTGGVVYSKMVNTNKDRGDASDPYGPNSEKHLKVSRRDAEVFTIDEMKSQVPKALDGMEPGSVARLEFHGNHGPCDPCKTRIESASKEWAKSLPEDASLQVGVFYSQETSETTRSYSKRTNSIGGTEPVHVGTRYGYKSSETHEVSYGSSNRRLFARKWVLHGPKSQAVKDNEKEQRDAATRQSQTAPVTNAWLSPRPAILRTTSSSTTNSRTKNSRTKNK